MTDPIAPYLEAYVAEAMARMSRGPDVLRTAVEKRFHEEDLYADLAQRIAKRCFDGGTPQVLEIGSGTGGVSVALARLGADVVGIEPSLSGVRASTIRAARHEGVRARFVSGWGERLPFPSCAVDLVVSFAVLEHVQDQFAVISEAFRVLRQGGRIHFEMPNYLYPREEHYRIPYPPLCPKPIGKLWARLFGKDPSFLDTLTYTTPGRVEALLRRAGFEGVHDVFRDHALERLDAPEQIQSRWVARLVRWSRALHVGGLLRFPIRVLRVYPEIHVEARKPAAP